MSFRVSFCSCVFSPFSIAITSLGEERANISAFRTFVRFVLVWICRFPVPLGVWEGLRFVILWHSLDFSLTFFAKQHHILRVESDISTYSGTSLSRPRLFRITAYLEVKIWSLF